MLINRSSIQNHFKNIIKIINQKFKPEKKEFRFNKCILYICTIVIVIKTYFYENHRIFKHKQKKHRVSYYESICITQALHYHKGAIKYQLGCALFFINLHEHSKFLKEDIMQILMIPSFLTLKIVLTDCCVLSFEKLH